MHKKLKKFFEDHPEAGTVFIAIGVIFLTMKEAEAFVAGTHQKITTVTRGNINEASDSADQHAKGDTKSTEGTEPGSAGSPSELTNTETGRQASGSEADEELVDHQVTELDLKTNPDLIEAGVSVGDVIKVPALSADSDADELAADKAAAEKAAAKKAAAKQAAEAKKAKEAEEKRKAEEKKKAAAEKKAAGKK